MRIGLDVLIECQPDEMLTNRGGELEAMTGEPRPEDDLRVLGMPIDDEVGVRRHRIHADRAAFDPIRDTGQVTLTELQGDASFDIRGVAVNRRGIGEIAAGMLRDLQTSTKCLLVKRESIDVVGI